MSQSIKNFLGVVCGMLVGSIANMSIIVIGSLLVPPQIGAYDNSTTEGLNAMMLSMRPIDFLFPFLAHALGTFIGAIIAGLIAVRTLRASMLIGAFFMAGGIYMVVKVNAPMWFEICDLLLAYLPTAWLAAKIIRKKPEEIG